ncbi:10970_t:CDS:2, partial [Funneliformis mosseae]
MSHIRNNFLLVSYVEATNPNDPYIFNEKAMLINSEQLDSGGFGSIIKAIWYKTNNYVVYKKLTDTLAFKCGKLNAFIYELKIHLHLNYSDRIVRFLGISQ